MYAYVHVHVYMSLYLKKEFLFNYFQQIWYLFLWNFIIECEYNQINMKIC